MKCSPRYIQDDVIKNVDRMWSQTACDYNCVHWLACWEELRGGSKRVLPLMSKRVLKGINTKKKGEWLK